MLSEYLKVRPCNQYSFDDSAAFLFFQSIDELFEKRSSPTLYLKRCVGSFCLGRACFSIPLPFRLTLPYPLVFQINKMKQVVFRAPDLSPSFVEAMDYVVNSLLRVKEQDLLTHIAQVTKEVRSSIDQKSRLLRFNKWLLRIAILRGRCSQRD
jgi:hypothetical protein